MDKLGLSLDELAAQKKSERGPSSRGRSSGSSRGGRGTSRPSVGRSSDFSGRPRGGAGRGGGGRPYEPRSRASDGQWGHDLFGAGPSAAASAAPARSEAPVKTVLRVTNLDYGVTDNDLKELFGEFGGIESTSIFYNREGASTGAGEVVFKGRQSAEKALRKYNGVTLDGKPMRLEILEPVNTSVKSRLGATHVATRVVAASPPMQRQRNSHSGSGAGPVRHERGTRVARGTDRRDGRSSSTRGGGRGGNSTSGPRVRAAPASVDDLDSTLDAYMAQGADASSAAPETSAVADDGE